MIFSSKEAQDAYHRLETGIQHNLAQADLALAPFGRVMLIQKVEGSKVLIEITDDLIGWALSPPSDER